MSLNFLCNLRVLCVLKRFLQWIHKMVLQKSPPSGGDKHSPADGCSWGVFRIWLLVTDSNNRNSAGSCKSNCKKLNLHCDHKGKIENIQISIDIPFACGCSFGLQLAGQIQFANPNNWPKSNWRCCHDDLAGQTHPNSNGYHPNLYCTSSAGLAHAHAFPA